MPIIWDIPLGPGASGDDQDKCDPKLKTHGSTCKETEQKGLPSEQPDGSVTYIISVYCACCGGFKRFEPFTLPPPKR